MTFGPNLRVAHPEFDLTLAPIRRKDMPRLAEATGRMSVTRFGGSFFGWGMTDEDADGFYAWLHTGTDRIVWGIHLSEFETTEPPRLVGFTHGCDITRVPHSVATTGVMLFEPALWGRGITSACHRARTWYFFHVLGFHALRSTYAAGNTASGKAVSRVGYVQTGLTRHVGSLEGRAVHEVHTECVNPADAPWARWWGSDPVPAEFVEARERTRAALAWADENVTLL